MKTNIKSIIKGVLPYAFIVGRRKRMMQSKYINLSLDNKESIEPEDSKYKNYIAVTGFGFSGHTAILDLLQEYRNTNEFFFHNCNYHYEMDFVRLAGGLFDIEKNIGSNNIFINDSLLQSTIKLFNTASFLKDNKRAQELTSRFLSSIIELKIEGLTKVTYNPHIQNAENPNETIYYLKSITKEEYIILCRTYINSLLNCYYEGHEDTIILDHIFSDSELDINHYKQYIPNIKVIASYRDPRDVYAQAISKNVEWIPKYDINSFIKRYKYSTRNLQFNNNSYLAISFEELICNYEETVAKIEDYLGLDKSNHIDKCKYLDPSKSIKNVGLWKQLKGKEYELSLIENELKDFIYSKNNRL